MHSPYWHTALPQTTMAANLFYNRYRVLYYNYVATVVLEVTLLRPL